MQCPDCGYMMSAFDKECSRCKGLGKQMRPASPPQVAPVAPLPQQAISSQQPATDVPSFANAPVIPGGALACPVCGNEATQKVTAICEGGTWTTKSCTQTTMIGSDGTGHMMMAGGPSVTSSLSQTGLASRLMPPAHPRVNSFNGFLILIVLVLGFIGLAAFTNGINSAWDVGPIAVGLLAWGAAVAIGYKEQPRTTYMR